nr:MAG TPA: hypothetical protein [Caudoviricetes sp.]
MQIEINNKAVLKTAGKYVAEDITIIAKGGNLPQLFAPSISLSGNTLTITPNTSNGGFSTDYSIYDGSTFVKTVTTTTVDLSTVFAESTIQHTVTVQATADNFQNSEASNSVTYANLKTYSITTVLTGFTASASNPTSIKTGEQKSLSFTLNDGYEFPESNPTVTGASFVSWSSSGVLVIKNPTANVTITIEATPLPAKLATPTNVTADDTTVSWDEVTNATSYDVYVDGAVYDTVTDSVSHTLTFPSSGLTVTVNNNTVTSPYTLQDGDEISIQSVGKFAIICNGDSYTDRTVDIQDFYNTDIVLQVGAANPVPTNLSILWHASEQPTPSYVIYAGTYKFIDNLKAGSKETLSELVNFVYNVTYTTMLIQNFNDASSLIVTYKGVTATGGAIRFVAYKNGAWTNEGVKTITFLSNQSVSPTFYKWAITDGNLVKQGSVSGEFWVINKQNITLPETSLTGNFISNDLNFNRIKHTDNILQYNNTNVYNTETGWYDEKLRTIYFKNAASGNMLTWLQANGVKQTEPTSETWLLNETVSTNINSFVFDFVSNNTNFKGIIAYDADTDYTLSYLVTTDFSQPQTEVYDENGVWKNQAFRTIILTEPATGDLLTWLQANGTKQEGGVTDLVTFTIETCVNQEIKQYTDCQGEAGMLFSEWLTSSYNTHNITYPVTDEECAPGYVPIALPDEQTIPGENGSLSLITMASVEF